MTRRGRRGQVQHPELGRCHQCLCLPSLHVTALMSVCFKYLMSDDFMLMTGLQTLQYHRDYYNARVQNCRSILTQRLLFEVKSLNAASVLNCPNFFITVWCEWMTFLDIKGSMTGCKCCKCVNKAKESRRRLNSSWLAGFDLESHHTSRHASRCHVVVCAPPPFSPPP